MNVKCWQTSRLNVLHLVTLTDHANQLTVNAAQPSSAQLACFIGPDMVRANVPSPSWSVFLPNVLNKLLTHFSHSIFSTSHMFAKMVSEQKLICYDDKSLKLIYLLVLAVFLPACLTCLRRSIGATLREKITMIILRIML